MEFFFINNCICVIAKIIFHSFLLYNILYCISFETIKLFFFFLSVLDYFLFKVNAIIIIIILKYYVNIIMYNVHEPL